MNMTEKFTVLMTTYFREKPENLEASLNSILVDQTLLPDQIVLVIDGPIPCNLDLVVRKFETKYTNIIDVVRSKKNQGQSLASAQGMKYVRNELIARMDSDDISVKDRFETELQIFNNHPEISVVGGWIEEFENMPGDTKTFRLVKEFHDDIVFDFRKRTPVNNVTTMLRKVAIDKAGGYGRATVNEDFSLYAHMWVNGAIFYNIQKVLVHVRVGNGMITRRNGLKIFFDWKNDQYYLFKNHKHNFFTYIVSNCKCLIFILAPLKVKKILYKTVLRDKVE
jgi:glycosyltransferase involved in cell wall biosynthesis